MGRTPHAEIDERADATFVQEFRPVRPHIPNLGDEIVPGITEASLFQVIDAFWVPERRAEPKEAVITQGETAVSCTAKKEIV